MLDVLLVVALLVGVIFGKQGTPFGGFASHSWREKLHAWRGTSMEPFGVESVNNTDHKSC